MAPFTMPMRFKRLYPKDVNSPTIQKNMNKYTRVGQISSVDPGKGTCTLVWHDRAGQKTDVLLMQGSHDEWNIPEVGAVVLVAFDHKDQARIIRYMNVGHAPKVTNNDLPALKEGEKLWRSKMGSILYMQDNGDILLQTASGTRFLLESTTSSFKTETVDWRLQTGVGSYLFGVIKRLKPSPDGSMTNQVITSVLGETLGEINLKLYESVEQKGNFIAPATPLIEIAMGTLVNKLGLIVNKLQLPNLVPTKEVCVQIKLSSGVTLWIDKAGRLTIQGVQININGGQVDVSDADVALGLEIPSTMGTQGQHVARQHDTVTVPLSSTYSDPANTLLTSKGSANISALSQLASAIISPTGPCFLNPSLLSGNVALQAEVTKGAPNVIVGDN